MCQHSSDFINFTYFFHRHCQKIKCEFQVFGATNIQGYFKNSQDNSICETCPSYHFLTLSGTDNKVFKDSMSYKNMD